VIQSLQKDPELAAVWPNIQVNANNGTVVLNGSIENEEQRQQIKSVVSSTRGVGGIDDQLQLVAQGAVLGQVNQQGRIDARESNSQIQVAEPAGPLMPTSRTNESTSLYQNAPTNGNNQLDEELLKPTSTNSDRLPQIYQNATNSAEDADNKDLSPTSSNSLPRIYKESSNSLNNANSNALSPTSRNAAPSKIYPPSSQKGSTPEQKTNGNQMP
jgi:hypothetical protein